LFFDISCDHARLKGPLRRSPLRPRAASKSAPSFCSGLLIPSFVQFAMETDFFSTYPAVLGLEFHKGPCRSPIPVLFPPLWSFFFPLLLFRKTCAVSKDSFSWVSKSKDFFSGDYPFFFFFFRFFLFSFFSPLHFEFPAPPPRSIRENNPVGHQAMVPASSPILFPPSFLSRSLEYHRA